MKAIYSLILRTTAIIAIFAAIPRPATAADEQQVKVSDQDVLWDPFFVGHIDAWNVTVAIYDRKVRPGKHISQDTDAIGAYFAKQDFEKYSSESKSHAFVKVLKNIETDQDKASVAKLVENWDTEKDAAFLTSDALGLIPAIARVIWPIQVVSVLSGTLDQTGYAKEIKKTRTSVKDLVAKGGHIDTEERLYQATEGDKPWMIYRCIVYRVKVGQEIKSVPLFVCSMHVFVE